MFNESIVPVVIWFKNDVEVLLSLIIRMAEVKYFNVKIDKFGSVCLISNRKLQINKNLVSAFTHKIKTKSKNLIYSKM